MKNLILVFTVLATLFGCQPEPDNLKLLDDLVVQTNYDQTADFGTYGTYSISTDTIGFISNTSRDTILVASGSSEGSKLVRPVLSQIRSNMNARGYSEVDVEEGPDLAVNVYIVNNLNLFQQVVDPGYYYPYYYGYDPYYYYYYPYIQTYTENTATLVLQIVDLKNVNENNEVKVVWNSYLGDLVSTVTRVEQTVRGIDQAFKQSPYLMANPQ